MDESIIARAHACHDLLLFGAVAEERTHLLNSGVPSSRVDSLYPADLSGLLNSAIDYVQGTGRIRLFSTQLAEAIESEENALWSTIGSKDHQRAHSEFRPISDDERAEGLWEQISQRPNVERGREEFTKVELALWGDEEFITTTPQNAEADFHHLFLAVWMLPNVEERYREAAARHLLNVVEKLLPDLLKAGAPS